MGYHSSGGSDHLPAFMDRFNDQSSGCQFLVISYKVGAQGLDMNLACHNGYIVQSPKLIQQGQPGIGASGEIRPGARRQLDDAGDRWLLRVSS